MKWCILKYITTTTTVAPASIGAHTERTLTENYFFKRNKIILFLLTAISTLLISNCNSFQVLFDNIVPYYILFEKYICILALEMASPGNQHCANCIGTLSFPIPPLHYSFLIPQEHGWQK